jgi:hypothetical protein
MNCHLNLIGAGLRLPHLERNGQYKEIARGIYRKEDEGALDLARDLGLGSIRVASASGAGSRSRGSEPRQELAAHPRHSSMSIASTGGAGAAPRYCSYLAARSARARSASSPASSTRARPRSRTHQSRVQSSS